MTLLDQNIHLIKELLSKHKHYIDSSYHGYINKTQSIKYVYEECKKHRYIATSLNIYNFIDTLIHHQFIKNEIITIGSRTISFYTTLFTSHSQMDKLPVEDIIKLVDSIYIKGFFSMTTALYIQDLSNYRPELIFHSQELTPKDIDTNNANYQNKDIDQHSIDFSFQNKDYRYTKNIGQYEDYHIISLSPKYTNNVGVVQCGDYKVSSIERALIEMVVNVHYFKNFNNLIEIFKPIKEHISIQKIIDILKVFNYIYPYYNSIGFLLEKIGFDKYELEPIKSHVDKLNFYTERIKESYNYNEYWKVYY